MIDPTDCEAVDAAEGLTPPDEHPPGGPGPTRKKMVLWDRIRLFLLFTISWLIIVWAAMADNPLLPFVDAARIEAGQLAVAALAGRRRGRPPAALLRQRALVGLPPVLDAAGVRRHRAGAAPAVLRLDPVPAGPGAQAGRVRRAARAGAGQGAGHLAGAGPVPGAGAALQRAAADLPAAVRVLLHRVPVHRAVLAALPRRGGHLLPGRHHHPVRRRLGPGPRGRAGQGEHRLPGEPGRDRGQGRLRALRACCCGARPAPARR